MNFKFFNLLLIHIAIIMTPTLLNADDASKTPESFLTVCVNSWMKKSIKSADQVDFKNFGEKYCACASNQQLTNDAAIKNAIQLCLSRTLLHDAMDALEEEVGLSDAKDTDIDEYCLDRWSLIYPNQTDADKKGVAAYCECAKPKLLDLIKESETITDKQYDETIDTIAAACSSKVNEHAPETNASNQ